MTKYPQVLINVRVATKTGWEDNDIIKAAIVTAEGELGDEGRVLDSCIWYRTTHSRNGRRP